MTQFIELTKNDGNKILLNPKTGIDGLIERVDNSCVIIITGEWENIKESYDEVKALIAKAQANDPPERIAVALEKIAKNYNTPSYLIKDGDK